MIAAGLYLRRSNLRQTAQRHRAARRSGDGKPGECLRVLYRASDAQKVLVGPLPEDMAAHFAVRTLYRPGNMPLVQAQSLQYLRVGAYLQGWVPCPV